ncbi:MAG TPA: hypothetical protein VLS48_03935 [Anaerolineales bacterium]|nr:hypothetical protein [Anaerolineales bacterium]
MKIVFESDLALPSVFKAISILTDRAKICINDIHYDETSEVVSIFMKRKKLIGFKNGIFGESQPIYQPNLVQSLLTVRQVKKMEIQINEWLIAHYGSCFHLLFGLKANVNQIYLGSVEDKKGSVLCQIFIEVEKISIELEDVIANNIAGRAKA